MKPIDAQYRAYGSWFKIGRYNKIFRWVNGEWMASTMSFGEIRNRHRSSIQMTEKAQAAHARRVHHGGSGRRPIPLVNGLKECRGKSGCGAFKPVSEFHPINSTRYTTHCKDCEKKRQQKISRHGARIAA